MIHKKKKKNAFPSEISRANEKAAEKKKKELAIIIIIHVPRAVGEAAIHTLSPVGQIEREMPCETVSSQSSDIQSDRVEFFFFYTFLRSYGEV